MPYTESVKKLLAAAGEKFGTLTLAEDRLFTNIAKGELAKYSVDSDKEDDPFHPNNWGAARTLTADRIIWLCTDPSATKWITHRGVCIKGARVNGILDLEDATLPFSLSFEACS